MKCYQAPSLLFFEIENRDILTYSYFASSDGDRINYNDRREIS